MLDWDDLRHFAVFAQAGSLTAAARRLEVEHATVARRIAALEAALGLKLVDRRERRYALTADGARIAALGRQMQDGADAVARAARAGQDGLQGEVALSAPPVTAATLIGPRLGELRRRHPGIALRVIAEKRFASLRSEVDLAVRLSRPEEPDLVVRRLGQLTFSFYASPQYLARTPPERFEFIGYDDALEDAPRLQQQWLRGFAGTRPQVLRCSSADVQQAAARAGAGVALLGDFAAAGDPGLARLDAGAATLQRDVWLVVHRDLRRAPAVRAVADFLARCMPVGAAGSGNSGLGSREESF